MRGPTLAKPVKSIGVFGQVRITKNKSKSVSLDDAKKLFMENVDTSSDCWLWKGPREYHKQRQYGRFCLERKRISAHRASWILFKGPIESTEIFVCHHCDNPPCVNTEHLFLGTSEENFLDARIKNRVTHPAGEFNSASKLTMKDVEYIRSHYRPRIVSHTKLAKRFGVCRRTIERVLNEKSWTKNAIC